MAFVVGCGDGGAAPVDSGGGGGDAGTADAGSGDAGSGNDSGTVDAAGTEDAGAVDAATAVDADVPATFTLTSSAFVEGGAIPVAHACTRDPGGMNISPQLAWTGAPAGTLSYAIFFRDISTNFAHSAIYDIPVVLAELPEDVDHTAMPADVVGARQPRGYPGTFGYAGPCPGSMHTYEFTIYALDVLTLPGVTGGTSLEALEGLFMDHSLGSATLSGTYDPP